MVDSLPYLITLPIYSILLLVETLIFLHFSIKTHKLDISPTIRNFALIIGVIVIFTLLLELFSTLFDLFSNKLFHNQSTIFCFIYTYIRCISFLLFECALFIFWVIRLKHTFRGSVLALSDTFIYAMFIILPSITATLILIFALFIDPIFYEINISFNESTHYGCSTSNNIGIIALFICGQLFSIIFNTFFAYFFYYKLTTFVDIVVSQSTKHDRQYGIENTSYNMERSNAINLLMQKHTLLALITVFSVVVSYIIFDVLMFVVKGHQDELYDPALWQYAFLFIDIDMIIKMTACLLMFKFYERRFYKLCYCCIRIIAVVSCDCMCCCKDTIQDTPNPFAPLAERAKDIAKNDSGKQYKDEYFEDRIHVMETNATVETDYDEETVSEHDSESVEELILGEYTFWALLIKAKMKEDNVTQKIFQYVRKDVCIDNVEGVFREINEESEAYGPLSSTNKDIFYYRNSVCKYPFIVAIKLDVESVNDGNILSRYVSKRVEDSLDKVESVKGFEYDSLFEDIIKEIRTRNVDLNIISNKRTKNKSQNTVMEVSNDNADDVQMETHIQIS